MPELMTIEIFQDIENNKFSGFIFSILNVK